MTCRALGVRSGGMALSSGSDPTGWDILSRLPCHSVPWPPLWPSRVNPSAVTSLAGMLCEDKGGHVCERFPGLSSTQMCGPVQPRAGSHSGIQVRDQILGWRDKGGEATAMPGREQRPRETVRRQPPAILFPHPSSLSSASHT